ncbi:hypothetical protein H6F86_21065 [Phormidium sp. FACHB-592]|uniref:Uncharacterized protein n=1 Tax=Stenomitos frigidus AS-A4 TaxID=2933935 RepID=A0ABV0KET1_9CYAN|nr:hypothetical protein [Phormidium sp. FACHB-592]MBD2076326.1 hypothetical protein [Phormidium sp. FACHB-592]
MSHNRTVKLALASAAITGTIATATVATIASIFLSANCAQAGRCGECYNTGRPGINVWDGRVSDCKPCAKRASAANFTPEKTIGGPKRTEPGSSRNANRDGIPGPRTPKKGDVSRIV